ncbi:hypothetical protein HHI36_006026 [Cryptolaemus montrouzieri]|uniref:Uncharacterized protein n=1 Tax=Cryptolaemus montrouzieri TaxID=559131 RepID=A0ABD2NWT6_9CUCU
MTVVQQTHFNLYNIMVILQLHEQPSLIQAIFGGDLDGTRQLLNSTIDVNLQDSEKRTALHAAAFKADVGITAALLEAGARVNAKDAKWITPLHRACSVNADKVVALLLTYNADVSARDRFWQTPLHVAAANNAYDSLELLLDHVPNLDVTDRSGKTALHHAAHNGHSYIADLLISRGCVVNASDKKYFRPLHCAAQLGHVDTIDLLIKCGADVNASDWNQYTPLHVAAANGNDSVCRLLLNAGANVDSQNTYGNTPLHIACLNGQQLVCQDLVNSGADPEAINFRGQTPVHIAAASAHGAECMMYLLSQKVDVNKRSLDGRTPLHMTAIHGRFTRSKSLIDQGAIIDCTDKNGCTPLHIAAQYGHDLLANTLMSYGANPSFKGHEGRTPLHMCCLSGFVECCRKFLVAGVDLNAVDDTGKTPLHCAAYKGSVECLDLLVSNGAKFLEKDNIGRLPLHYSASQGHYQCVFTLVGIGSPTNDEDAQGCAPLHLAAGYDKEGKCVEYLLEHSADPFKRDKRGFTPLHYAAAGNNTNAVDILQYANIYKGDSPTQVTPLHLAAKLGNDDIVQAILEQGVDVNAQDLLLGITALMLAAREGHLRCVQSLVGAGASVIICDKTNNMTAVHYSAKNGHHECLLQMLRKKDGKKSINMVDSLQRTALMLAVSSNHIECVRALLEYSEDVEKVVNMEDADSHSSLFRAVVFGQSKIVQLLLTKNAKANLADVNGKRVIHLAAACGHLACLQILLEFLEPEDITVMDSQQCSALHWACYRGNTSCVELLLQKNLFKILEGNKFSPVHCASFSGSVQCLQLLVNSFGTEIIHLQDSRKRFPLHICALHGHTDAAKYLLDQGAEVDVLDEEERTPFIAAAQFGQNQIIELLLNYKLNKTFQDKYGNTALHWACLMKHNPTALLLLKDMNDSNVIHSVNKENKTALHLAARNGLVDVTRELLKKGASVLAVDSEGYTPALCCAPNNQVAQCLALILLNLKHKSTEENDPKQSLNSFLQNVDLYRPSNQKNLSKTNKYTQTSKYLLKDLCSSDIRRLFGVRLEPPSWSRTTKILCTSFPPLSKSTCESSWKKDPVTGKDVFGSEEDCFLIEKSDFGETDLCSKIVGSEREIHMGLNLHRSYSDMSITSRNENKINLEGTIRVHNLKELSKTKKGCRECILWQRRCSDCTIRYILRQHLQGKISPREFNDILMKTLDDASIEYRRKLIQTLELMGKEFENRRHKDFTPDVRRVVRLDRTRQPFGRNRWIPFNKTQVRMDTRDLTSIIRRTPAVKMCSWPQKCNFVPRNAVLAREQQMSLEVLELLSMGNKTKLPFGKETRKMVSQHLHNHKFGELIDEKPVIHQDISKRLQDIEMDELHQSKVEEAEDKSETPEISSNHNDSNNKSGAKKDTNNNLEVEEEIVEDLLVNICENEMENIKLFTEGKKYNEEHVTDIRETIASQICCPQPLNKLSVEDVWIKVIPVAMEDSSEENGKTISDYLLIICP